MSNRSDNSLFALVLGVIAGILTGLFLTQTEKGRETSQRIGHKVGELEREYGPQIKQTLGEADKAIKDIVAQTQSLANQANAAINDLSSQAKQAYDNATNGKKPAPTDLDANNDPTNLDKV